MLKSLPTFKRTSAHLVEKKDVLRKTKTFHSQGLSALNMQFLFLFVSSFEHVKFSINGKYSKKIMTIKLLCFTCDFSNIQKCSFKECPFIWVAPLTMSLPHCNCIGLFYANRQNGDMLNQ